MKRNLMDVLCAALLVSVFATSNIKATYASEMDKEIVVSEAVSYTHLRAHETPEHLG